MSDTEQTLLTTPRFRVVRLPQEGNPGDEPRFVVRHPGAVIVAPLLRGGRVCLIRNYRRSVGQTLIEAPAGTLAPGEDPRVAAARELTEETGYRAGELIALGSFFLSPGILDERMHVYVAPDPTPGDPAREAGELIENLEVPWGEALAMIDRGEIRDAKTIATLLMVDRRRAEWATRP